MDLREDLYWDPFDVDIDTEPYEIWRRLRDEQPVYRNERYDFYALSRFDDVEAAHRDPATYLSSHGTVLEIMGDQPMDTGMMIFLDPPDHTRLRTLVSRAFTPRRIASLEDRIRELCAAFLDALGAGRAVRLRAGLRRPPAGDGDRLPARRAARGAGGGAPPHRRHVPHRAGCRHDQRHLAHGDDRPPRVPHRGDGGPSPPAARRPPQRPPDRRVDRHRRHGSAPHDQGGRRFRQPADQRRHRDRRPVARVGCGVARHAPRPAGRPGRGAGAGVRTRSRSCCASRRRRRCRAGG